MQAIEREILRDREREWTYTELAGIVYRTGSPTRAQLSAVARAVAGLRTRGTVYVSNYHDDERICVVRSSSTAVAVHKALLRVKKLDRLGRRRGLTYRQLSEEIFKTATPSTEQINTVIGVCDVLATAGLVDVWDDYVAQRRLTDKSKLAR
jgi:hypothetical protein